MKTTRDRFTALAQVIRANHSYEVPDIVSVPIVDGTDDYREWISSETQEPGALA
jgi:periplasmic divalent cation tolerance protein